MHDHLEDARKGQPIDAEQALSDEALEAGGLAPVKAWVRTRQSANAVRTQRHKEKLAAAGVRQLNLQAPEALHEALKEMAQAAREGRDWRAPALSDEARRVVEVMERGGVRARLIRWLVRR